MRYTLLNATERGVVLWAYHLERLGPELGPGSAARAPLLAFAKEARDGTWALWVDHHRGLRVERRAGTRLFDGMPCRLERSPLPTARGPIPKPSSPGPYDALRVPGTAALLTSLDGAELYEACSAAIVAWDGHMVLCPPECPRVWSTAEAAIREHLQPREEPIPAGSEALLLVNAVKGTCALSAASRGFPAHARLVIEQLFAQLTCRPTDLEVDASSGSRE